MQVNSVRQKLQLVKRVCRLMGNRFEISVVTEDESWAQEQINAAVNEICRIEQLLTTYNDQSQTALINLNAGNQPVQVDREVVDLIERSIKNWYGKTDRLCQYHRSESIEIRQPAEEA